MGIRDNNVYAVVILERPAVLSGDIIVFSEKLSGCEVFLFSSEFSLFWVIRGNKWFLLIVGIDVKKGRGRYIDTCMVVFAPRYLLDNKSSHKLAFAQREFARGQVRSFAFGE